VCSSLPTPDKGDFVISVIWGWIIIKES